MNGALLGCLAIVLVIGPPLISPLVSESTLRAATVSQERSCLPESANVNHGYTVTPGTLSHPGAFRYGFIMRLEKTDHGHENLIHSYGPEGIQIGGRTYRGSLILTPRQIITEWGPTGVNALAPRHMQSLIDLHPEVIVLGTGSTQVFPDQSIYRLLVEQRIGIEVMDTGAACRTYNILMAEARHVVAGLLPL